MATTMNKPKTPNEITRKDTPLSVPKELSTLLRSMQNEFDQMFDRLAQISPLSWTTTDATGLGKSMSMTVMTVSCFGPMRQASKQAILTFVFAVIGSSSKRTTRARRKRKGTRTRSANAAMNP